MKKYVLEIGGPSMYIGYSVESRQLHSSYEAAKKAFDDILNKNYTKEDIEELEEECRDNTSGDSDYLDSWMDDENDVYLAIYSVTEVK